MAVAWYAVGVSSYENAGRNSNQTYVNVIRAVQPSDVPFASLPPAPAGEFFVEITQVQFDAIKLEGVFYEGYGNLPRWQSDLTDLGSYADPTDSGTTFTADVQVSDPRWIIRIYNNSLRRAQDHIAAEDLDEDDVSPSVTRYLRLFNADDTQSTTNAQDQRTEIGGKLMIFDFTNGDTDFNVALNQTGEIVFPSNGRYRIVGPGGENEVRWQIFGRTLEVEQ